ncbi:MAG: protein adenylyltransferase SelO family protein, partial [Flavobacteriales bacterium]
MIKENEDIKASSFTQELPEDPSHLNQSRIVEKACFSRVNPEKFPNGGLVHTNPLLQAEMGLETLNESEILMLTLGFHPDTEGNTFAMCYGGHQFGQWAGQLGDGRAINIGEVEHEGRGYALQIKGAGPTAYSRRADGFAVLRSSIREYLCSESMFHLGVPTTRALSLALSGNKVRRDPMYDGNPLDERGAIVCRVAPSFIRFGNFQILAAREDKENLKKLLKYTIKHHFPEIKGNLKTQAVSLLKAIADKTREMIIHWQRVGFVHGVMNTDNMSIHGITIDYGPYGWLENYDETWTPNTTDAQNKRYGFQKQLKISLWNLLQLANGLYPLVDDAAPLEEILHEYDD